MAAPRTPKSEVSARRDYLRGFLSLKVVAGLLVLAFICFWNFDLSSYSILGVRPEQRSSEKPHLVPTDGPGKQGTDKPGHEVEPQPTVLPQKTEKEQTEEQSPEQTEALTRIPSKGGQDESLEEELDIEGVEEDNDEVAWVPKKEEPKRAVVEPHASPPEVDLRGEIFECNYTDSRSDFCTMRGDVQVDVHEKSFRLLAQNASTPRGRLTIKPFPRKQFPTSLDTVTELTLESVDAPLVGAAMETELECSEVHEVPAVVFSTAGHTGNYYHDMTDGWVPIYITTYPYEREVVFIVSDPVGWWFEKYAGLINALTKYPVLKLGEDQPLHCFREVRFGLISHGDMAVDESLPPNIRLEWLGQRWAKVAGFPVLPTRVSGPNSGPLKLGWVHRAEKERNVLNEEEVLDKARSMGFEVVVLNRFRSMEEMFQIIQPLDVLAGLHGSGLSNFIFMRGNCVLIQFVPFQLEWFSDNSFGIGAQISRVKYISPALSWNESSLSQQFPEDSDVRLHPDEISERDGWQAWAHYYLEANVTLRMETVQTALQEAKDHLLTEGAVAEHRPWLKPFSGFRKR